MTALINHNMRKLIILCLGFFLTLALFEIFLRILSHRETQRVHALHNNTDQKTILCLGNSFTDGVGAPKGQAYPDHLQNKIDQIYGKNKFSVINGGMSGSNTTQLLSSLGSLVVKHHPSLVILQMGNSNFMNTLGYRPLNFLERIPYYDNFKFIKFINLLTKTKLKERSQLPQVNFFPFVNKWQQSQTQSHYKEPQDFNIEENEFIQGQEYSKALSFFRGKIQPIFPDKKEMIQQFKKENFQIIDDSIKIFSIGIQKYPRSVHHYLYLAETYLRIGQFNEAFDIAMKGLEMHPRYKNGDEYNPLYAWLFFNTNSFSQFSNRDATVRYFLKKYHEKNPDVAEFRHNLVPVDFQEISKWVTRDLKEIVHYLNARKIKILIQNYPVNSKDPHLMEGNLELKFIANEFSLPFVDQERFFVELLTKDNNPFKYFYNILGKLDDHPNSLGYQMIANNLFEKMQSMSLLSKI